MPTCAGAFSCNAFAFAMISAYDPLGGGFEDTGAAFRDADGCGTLLFNAGFAVGVAMGRGLETADEEAVIGLERGCLLVDDWVRGF